MLRKLKYLDQDSTKVKTTVITSQKLISRCVFTMLPSAHNTGYKPENFPGMHVIVTCPFTKLHLCVKEEQCWAGGNPGANV